MRGVGYKRGLKKRYEKMEVKTCGEVKKTLVTV